MTADRVVYPVRLPDLGTEDQPLRVSTWLTQIGEDVQAGEAIVEIVLRGITFDVDAPLTGRLRRIERFESDLVKVGDVLGWLEAT
jgi:pyruvate/2-oxoglutarate dehydrogenase complex dihydrolipoamide acyltransferase (E2) component